MLGSWTAIVSIFYVFVCVSAASWENVHYTRNLDLSRGYVKENHLILAKNTGDKPQNEYSFHVDDAINTSRKLSVLVASFIDTQEVLVATPLPENPSIHIINFPIPVAPGSEVEFKVRLVYISAISPFPEKLEMKEEQTLLFKLNKYPYSAYVTKEATLVFSGIGKGQEMQLLVDETGKPFAKNNTDELPLMKPRVENKSLVYGPVFWDILPYTVDPMGLHYDHNRPLAKVHELERSIWIPALNADKISFEEYYELTNDAASLKSGFLRVDWMKGRYDSTRNHWAISQLEVKLPNGEEPLGIYYTDKVGQVSTSKVFQEHLILQPRYPIFGGWKYNFTIGWNSPIGDYVHRLLTPEEKDNYIVKFPVLNSIQDITYDSVLVHFYLPEDAEFLGVGSAVNYDDLSIDNELSYLDISKGHVRVNIKYSNLIDDLSKTDIFVKYRYSQASYWWKVLKISGFVFTGLVSYYLLSLIDLSIEKEQPKKK